MVLHAELVEVTRERPVGGSRTTPTVKKIPRILGKGEFMKNEILLFFQLS